jgi:predicted dehydrogenase
VNETSTYLLDAKNGATMLSIPFGHTVDALCWMLGDFEELSATLSVRRKQARVVESGRLVDMTAPDQVAVSGTLKNGAVASIHYRAGSSRATGLLWEINGTAGDLIIEGESGHMQYGRIKIRGGQGKDKSVSDLPVPDRYRLVNLPARDLSYTVAHAYKGVLSDIRHGTRLVPSFADALVPHSLVETISLAASTGQRQLFRPASLGS